MRPFCLLHLTDPHLPPPGELLFGRDPAPNFGAALAEIATRHGPDGPLPAAFAVLTGDLVRDGEPAAYERLRGMLHALPCPAHLLLGNHDDRPAFRDAFPDRPCDPHGFVQQAIPTEAGLCVMLDTLEPGQAAGRLCTQRLRWLAARLAESEGPVLLFLHHPPLGIGMPAMDRIALQDPDAFWAVLAPHAPRLRHLFFGHVHRPVAGTWRGVPISSVSGTAFRIPLTLDTGDVRPTGRELPSYAVVRVCRDDLVVLPREVSEGVADS